VRSTPKRDGPSLVQGQRTWPCYASNLSRHALAAAGVARCHSGDSVGPPVSASWRDAAWLPVVPVAVAPAVVADPAAMAVAAAVPAPIDGLYRGVLR
jgi:hypothetical protein